MRIRLLDKFGPFKTELGVGISNVDLLYCSGLATSLYEKIVPMLHTQLQPAECILQLKKNHYIGQVAA
ncbi:hypothetical protein CU633_10260 [Bacillus sp. V3-13]|uniref:hypothetical protein n=1 Tax=Bacillus sp. V3-13 TaxID=2053728 RepID=UPI000C780CB8|nr:hypothetical protein [Bacillus sp. V3-13]PLR77509.1 hypothetical protein CU633_10260 [Bacillus sp. V3-13]